MYSNIKQRRLEEKKKSTWLPRDHSRWLNKNALCLREIKNANNQKVEEESNMVFIRIDRLGLGQIFNGNRMTKLALDRPIRLGFNV